MTDNICLYKSYKGRKVSVILEDDNIENAINYKPTEIDRILVTGHKCGALYAQQIIDLLIDKNRAEEKDPSYSFKNWLEYHGGNGIQNNINGLDKENLVFVRTYLWYDLLPYNKSAKYLLVLRNPKDIVVSSYYYLQKNQLFDFDFHHFFKIWINGHVPFGDYFYYAKQYWIHFKNDQNFTILLYEEMKRDIKQSIETIAQFLGQKYVNRLSNDDKLMDEIIQKSSFDFMKDFHKNNRHLRKGVVGDWRSHLTKDESDLIDKRVAEEWMGTGLELLWKEEMKWVLN